jgi:hypothetical protein
MFNFHGYLTIIQDCSISLRYTLSVFLNTYLFFFTNIVFKEITIFTNNHRQILSVNHSNLSFPLRQKNR